MKIVNYKTKIFSLIMGWMVVFFLGGCGDSGGGGDGDSNPVISLSASTLNFTAEVGGDNPQSQKLTMSNSGGGLLQYTASTETAWLDGYSVDNSSNNAAITVIVDITGLSAGSYTGTITISAPGVASKTITVSLTVTDGTSNPVISLSTSTLDFTAEAGGTNPQDQTVTISNSGGGLLQYTASTETAWLDGYSVDNSSNNAAITVIVDITGLSAGSYTGTITISAPGVASKTITVSLTVTDTAAQATKWTVMVYSMADTNLEEPMMEDIGEMLKVGSTDDMIVVAQIDRREGEYEGDVGGISNWTTAKRFVVRQGSLEEKVELGELNSGDPQTLSDFLIWGKTNFPGDRYVLILSDHGSSWPGFGGDDSHQTQAGPDSLPLDEITTALQTAQVDLDIIGFDACLMANLEVAYELTPFADILVASEELEPGHGWDYTAILNSLKANLSQTPAQLGQVIADSYKAHAEAFGQTYRAQGETYNDEKTVTLSVIDLSKIVDLVSAVDQLATSIKGKLDIEVSTLDFTWLGMAESRSNSEEYGSDPDPTRGVNVVDLNHLVGLIKNNVSDTTVSNNVDAVLTALNQAVSYKIKGDDKPNASGISIYFPSQQSAFNEDYNNLVFASNTFWIDMIAAYLGLEAQDITEPTVVQSTVITGTDINGNLIIEAQFADNDIDQIDVYITTDTVLMGMISIAPDVNGIVSVVFDGSWFTLCSGQDNCVYAPFMEIGEIDDTTSLIGVDVLYTPSGETQGIDGILLLEYDWLNETGTVLGIVPDIENGIASKEAFPIGSGDTIQVFYLDLSNDTFVSGLSLIVGTSGVTVENYLLPIGDYDIGFVAYDYAGNDSDAGIVTISIVQ